MRREPKIPYGWHPGKQRLVDPQPLSVDNGDNCGCICYECRQPLQAVQGPIRTPHFRHKAGSDCSGNIESLMHRAAKQILLASSEVSQGDGQLFRYDVCEIEKVLHDKRPDAYLKNTKNERDLIVEIYFSHCTNQETLRVYQEAGKQVLEIDISGAEGHSMEELNELVLYKAKRWLHDTVLAPAIKMETTLTRSDDGKLKKMLVPLLGIFIILIFWLRKRKRRKR